MSSEWVSDKLGRFIELKRGYDLPKAKRHAGEVPLVSSAGVSDTHSVAMVSGPGVVTGRYGTLGKVFYIERDFWPLNTTLYVKSFKGNDPKFIYYFLHTLDFLRYSDKAAVPGVNRNHLHKAMVCMPPLSMQIKIAELLSAFDDRITLLRETNKTLESIAQAIFKSWFIDFDPVHAKMEGRQPEGMDEATAAVFPDSFEESEPASGANPQGWQKKGLDEIANYINGLALQKFPPTGIKDLPVIKISQLRRGDTTNSDLASGNIAHEYVVHDGDILFSWSGSLEVEIWCGGDGALNQHLFKVTSSSYPKWFYYLWTRHYLPSFRQIAASRATTMGHIQRKHLTAAMVTVPCPIVMKEASKFFTPLFDARISNALRMRNLMAIRDTLLPRLISGRLRLQDAVTLVEEASS